MSRFALLVLGCILIGHLIIYASAAVSAKADHQPAHGQHRSSAIDIDNPNREQALLLDASGIARGQDDYGDLDLTELTPSLESQLYQAERLNRADSEQSMGELADSKQAEDSGSRSGLTLLSLVREPSTSLRRRSNVEQADNNYNNYYRYHFDQRNLRGSPGVRAPARGRSPSNSNRFQQDSRDYDDFADGYDQWAPPPQFYDQESVARRSLKPSATLRDLLLAQEARARARYIEEVVRYFERMLAGANPNSRFEFTPGDMVALADKPWFSRVVDYVKDKFPWGKGGSSSKGSTWKRGGRCGPGSAVGLANPPFCVNQDFIGAMQYKNTRPKSWDIVG